MTLADLEQYISVCTVLCTRTHMHLRVYIYVYIYRDTNTRRVQYVRFCGRSRRRSARRIYLVARAVAHKIITSLTSLLSYAQ